MEHGVLGDFMLGLDPVIAPHAAQPEPSVFAPEGDGDVNHRVTVQLVISGHQAPIAARTQGVEPEDFIDPPWGSVE